MPKYRAVARVRAVDDLWTTDFSRDPRIRLLQVASLTRSPSLSLFTLVLSRSLPIPRTRQNLFAAPRMRRQRKATFSPFVHSFVSSRNFLYKPKMRIARLSFRGSIKWRAIGRAHLVTPSNGLSEGSSSKSCSRGFPRRSGILSEAIAREVATRSLRRNFSCATLPERDRSPPLSPSLSFSRSLSPLYFSSLYRRTLSAKLPNSATSDYPVEFRNLRPKSNM